jgi:hypothetical protein
MPFPERSGKWRPFARGLTIEGLKGRTGPIIEEPFTARRVPAALNRQHFGYDGYSDGTETKIFGEPEWHAGTLGTQ